MNFQNTQAIGMKYSSAPREAVLQSEPCQKAPSLPLHPPSNSSAAVFGMLSQRSLTKTLAEI